MKKTYIAPSIKTHQIMMRNPLLNVSGNRVTVTDTDYDPVKGDVLGRGFAFEFEE